MFRLLLQCPENGFSYHPAAGTDDCPIETELYSGGSVGARNASLGSNAPAGFLTFHNNIPTHLGPAWFLEFPKFFRRMNVMAETAGGFPELSNGADENFMFRITEDEKSRSEDLIQKRDAVVRPEQ